MSGLLSEFIEVLWPSLPEGLRSAGTKGRLESAAAAMAPIPNVALEFHSLCGPVGIDVQQRVRRAHGEAERLLAHLEARFGDDKAWCGLRHFCEAWLDPAAPLGASIPEIYLEYDLQAADPGTSMSLPSVFVVFDAPDGDGNSLGATREALRLLAPSGLAEDLLLGAERGFAACPKGAYIGAIGVMLGRSERGVRVNYKRVRLEAVGAILDDLRWRGASSDCLRWAEWAFDRVDRVTVALDVGAETWPHLGLECILLRQPNREPRWQALLDECAERGLCAPESARSLCHLPGITTPLDSSSWPAQWIADTLLGPEDRFSTLERQLFHLKLTVAGGRVGAKVYGGAGHVWRQADGRLSPEEPARHETSVPCHRVSATIAEAMERAIRFLRCSQEQSGRWWDFELPAGASDEWVTAFLGTHLADAVDGRSAASNAWDALRRRRGDADGWGYNRLTPPDADSTAWALRLAARLRKGSDPRAQAARRFLNRHALPEGGVTTYVAREPIRAFAQLPESASLRGWQSAHPCVAAAAAPFLDEDPRDFLRHTLETAGASQGYWWWDEEYTRALAVEGLRGSTNPEDIEAVSRGCAWAVERIGDDGAVRSPSFGPSAFATAWAVYLLAGEASAAARQAAQRAVALLTQNQLDDGSWPASARLRVPMPGDTDPEASKRRLDVLDERRLFTTASVLAALQRFERGEADAGS